MKRLRLRFAPSMSASSVSASWYAFAPCSHGLRKAGLVIRASFLSSRYSLRVSRGCYGDSPSFLPPLLRFIGQRADRGTPVYVTIVSSACVIDRFTRTLDKGHTPLLYLSMDYNRIERVIAHLRKHREGNRFYDSVLRQYELLGRISPKQVLAVEASMARDTQAWQSERRTLLAEWNEREGR